MLCLIAALATLAGPACEDVSPNLPNGATKSRASTAGLTLAVAGDRNTLYAVSLNAGVWRSDRGGPWHQLSASPPNANCIAVDPANVRHIAVGERNGFAVNMRLNHCGVWESTDAGEHWRFLLDPATLRGSDSEAVPAIAFDQRSNLFVATPAGIGVKKAGSMVVSLNDSPPGVGRVTALSADGRGVWARTATKLMRTLNAGTSWEVVDIPQEVGADKVAFSSRGDLYSLGGSPTVAFMTCVLNPGIGGNRNSLIAYDVASKRWFTQSLASGNGTGLGGRRFAKFESGNLIYGGGQEIHQAPLAGYGSADSQIKFDMPVQANWGGPYGTPPHGIHSDTWDMHLDPSFSPASQDAWIACDGGIFASSPQLREPAGSALRLFDHLWLPHNDGLHTHHIHTITALEMPGEDARLAYPTSDNEAFYFDPQRGWMNEPWLGDVNWTAGDAGNPSFALLVRRSAGFAILTAFRQAMPEGAGFDEDQGLTLCNDEHYDGPTSFAFIQTLSGETPEYPLLDAVRIVDLPLKTNDGKPVPGPLGEARANPVLIRNTAFAAAPDANASKFSGWKIECDLPAGATGFCVSGGHAQPVYYVAASGQVYRIAGGRKEPCATTSDGKAFTLLPGNQFGPVFANPYDSNQVYVLAKDGVKVSADGGKSFHDDRDLTGLLTARGKYPIAAGELTGNNRGVILASRANATATLAAMAFDRQHPSVAVACSPFTGVFMREGNGGWRSYEKILPAPRTAIVAVAIAHGSIYCATEGRGVLRIRNYRQ